MGKLTISMAIFNSYVSLPEGNNGGIAISYSTINVIIVHSLGICVIMVLYGGIAPGPGHLDVKEYSNNDVIIV